MLSPGLGVSSLIFSIDTIETNLLEYLYANGYDCWLFDYRTSIALESAKDLASGDVIALLDYPAAVDKVREVTGAPSVQMVAHCFGSTTFFMAMLGGLQGVRAAVSSQIATHIRTGEMTRIKAGLHLPSVLGALGVQSMTAYSEKHENWRSRLFDDLLRIQPIDRDEHCHSDVCHRITFLYSLLYEHEQLNEATHRALVEMFGVANVSALDHLSLLVREGIMKTADGKDDYMTHLDRLAIPITFIHGAENRCFLPVSTELTYDLLRKTNGAELYQRFVIPGYGHIDCIYGKDAVRDVYPHILARLEETAMVERAAPAVVAGSTTASIGGPQTMTAATREKQRN
jgi:cholesterol oxidase